MKFKNIKKKAKKIQSPSNSRSIPDFAKASASAKTTVDKSSGETEKFKFSFTKIDSVKLLKLYGGALKVFVAGIFIVAVIVVGIDFQKNLKIKQNIDSQREAITEDLNFWEDFISKNKNYPDAYFQASGLEYQLGNMSRAKMYVEQGLVLDPNSTDGIKLEKLLSR